MLTVTVYSPLMDELCVARIEHDYAHVLGSDVWEHNGRWSMFWDKYVAFVEAALIVR